MSTRRDLLATSSAKVDALAMLAPMLARSTRALVFTHTKDGADAAATALCGAGVPTAWWHNGLEPAVRRNVLRDLRAGQLTAIAAPKVLDEGLDLPTVDAVVVLAASRSFRQLVQRVSAILRRRSRTGCPVVVVVHARGTVDADDGLRGGARRRGDGGPFVRRRTVGRGGRGVVPRHLAGRRAVPRLPDCVSGAQRAGRRTDVIEATTPSVTVTELTAPANGAAPPKPCPSRNGPGDEGTGVKPTGPPVTGLRFPGASAVPISQT